LSFDTVIQKQSEPSKPEDVTAGAEVQSDVSDQKESEKEDNGD